MAKKVKIIKDLSIDPDGDLDELVEFFETFPQGDEFAEYCAALGDLGRNRYAMTAAFCAAYEEEVRYVARALKDEHVEVSWSTTMEYEETTIEYIDNVDSQQVNRKTKIESDLWSRERGDERTDT